ncbi:5-methylcytosine restriction system specificity protein McrC [Natronomonas salsuginis]|uniref:Restriction endonuclease n=1 Tax=Natronomonas salsuginis TaxID=2217661 RepID=A0A4U5JJQ4_9EURY|nr:hypothetical protein [Natronomonas salsuginis]TKR27987.1 hypothetical protein DM868_02590 [Natronomonas salsuginis]
MSDAVRYEYGTSLCTVQEDQKLVVENCDPATIREELEAANFQRNDARFVKRRARLRSNASDDEDDSLQVLAVRVAEDTLHVEPSDVIGIVGLVPGMSVQIEPKIEWGDVVRMLLTVYDIDRTQTPYGIPLEELTSGGIEASRIIAILAINYVHGVRTIKRKGFIRDLNIQRRNGFEGIGSIDMSQTLMNQATGKPEPAWIESQVDYSNVVNEAIHMAGKLLLRLLHRDSEEEQHPGHGALLSMVHQEVERMEDLGIGSRQQRLGEYRQLTLNALPRQRHYYQRALHTAHSVLASTLLAQTGSGPEELLVDYALSMNALFEDYSQKVLERGLQSIAEIDHLDQLTNLEIDAEPPLEPFEGNNQASYYPDHLVVDNDVTLAVLDSKYYQEGKNPANETNSRSRMFSYAYLTETDRMAFLCPQFHRTTLVVNNIDASVDILSPNGGFSCESYESLLHEYLLETIELRYPEIGVFNSVREGMLCLQGVSEEDLAAITEVEGPFGISNPSTFASKVISAISFSTHGPGKLELENSGGWTKSRIIERCNKKDDEDRPMYPQDQTTCVPVYTPDGDTGHGTITLNFFRQEEDGLITKLEESLSLI